MSNFPERLRALLAYNKETHQALADAIGSTRQSVSMYVLGNRKHDYDLFQKIAEHYGVSMDYLAGRETGRYRRECEMIRSDIAKDVNAIIHRLEYYLNGGEAL